MNMKPTKGYKTKVAINMTVDVEVMQKFKELTDKKAVNRSKLIEGFMKEWMKANAQGN